MSWGYIEYSYPVSHVFQKELIWLDKNCNVYFAFKQDDDDESDWIYFSGNASHALETGHLLSLASSETVAQTNYLTTTRDTNGKVLAILPMVIEAKYARLYVESGSAVTLYEWTPSTYFTAHEIIAGEILISDDLSDSPSLKIEVSGQERIFIGDLGSDVYGIRGKDSSGNITFELSSNEDIPYIYDYADSKQLELELMKINFQYTSWAQFAVFDDLSTEDKRANPDPSTNQARVYKSKLDNGEDTTADKEFGFVSITYEDITTVETGTSTDVGLNYLEDTSKNWFTDECKNLTLKDSAAAQFTITGNNANTLTISGTPSAGAYSLIDDNPAYAVAFCSFSDSTNGGNGYVKMEVSFDGGLNYQTFIDSESGIDYRQATRAIVNTGTDYIVRLTLKNDGSGNGPEIYKFLVCTDPSPWRF